MHECKIEPKEKVVAPYAKVTLSSHSFCFSQTVLMDASLLALVFRIHEKYRGTRLTVHIELLNRKIKWPSPTTGLGKEHHALGDPY